MGGLQPKQVDDDRVFASMVHGAYYFVFTFLSAFDVRTKRLASCSTPGFGSLRFHVFRLHFVLMFRCREWSERNASCQQKNRRAAAECNGSTSPMKRACKTASFLLFFLGLEAAKLPPPSLFLPYFALPPRDCPDGTQRYRSQKTPPPPVNYVHPWLSHVSRLKLKPGKASRSNELALVFG